MDQFKSIILLAVFVGFPFVLLVCYLFTGKRKRAMRRWPTANAVVEQARGEEKATTWMPTSYFPVILYSYQVDGEFFSGERKFLGRYNSSETAQSAVKKWLGKKIIIHYCPSDPAKSVFLEGEPLGTIAS